MKNIDRIIAGLKRTRIINVLCALGVVIALCTACAPASIDDQRTSASTSVVDQTPLPTIPVATETAIPPTATPKPTTTATPAYAIDPEKFHNFPESYAYLLAHPDEFVESPNPVTNRAAFDKWFREQLLPALGPVSEREVNFQTGGGAGGRNVWEVYPANRKQFIWIGEKHFFTFENAGVVYPVPCITYEDKRNPQSKYTLCPALFTAANFYFPENGIEALNNRWRVDSITIVYDPLGHMGDIDWGEGIQELVTSVGDYPMDDNRVKFGFGIMQTFEK